MSFSELGLCERIVGCTTAAGYTTPTEIQGKTIPAALEGRDILGCAPTGTGKTAAFVLPIVHNLQVAGSRHRAPGCPRALILVPTRELAHQVEMAVGKYGCGSGLRALAIYGGVNMSAQLRDLKRAVDIVVATPGRLLDHMQRGSIDLAAVEVLVLDEADRMYDMGFIRAVRKIVADISSDRQTLLFSATMSKEIRALVAEILDRPHQVTIGDPFSPVDTVDQRFYGVPTRSKAELLLHVVRTERPETMLVFSRTKHGADKIVRNLQRAGVHCDVIHSNRSQAQRQRALDGFKRRKYRVLVATDIAARGIDVDKISHVVNFDAPVFAEDYIHRVGRTGRAQERGIALTFVSQDEEKYVRRIERLVGKRFSVGRYPDFEHGEVFSVPVQAPAPAQRPTAGRPFKPFRGRERAQTTRFGRPHRSKR